jgi:hypothetical protein
VSPYADRVTGGGRTLDVVVAQAKQAEADRGSCRHVYALLVVAIWSPAERVTTRNVANY